MEPKGKKAKGTGEQERKEIAPVKWPFGSCDPVKWFLTAVVSTDAFESITKCQAEDLEAYMNIAAEGVKVKSV